MSTIDLATRAVKDLRRLDRPDRDRVRDALQQLAAGAENLDIKALTGSAPWLRLRVGDWRVLYRLLTDAEAPDGAGLLVARVVHRRDLLRAVGTLGN